MHTEDKKTAVILVADDSRDDLRLIAEILSREGYNIHPVMDGAAALDSIRAQTPDLILLDVRMPKLNGFQVFRQIKKESPTISVPVIFLSASGSLDDIVKAFSMGAVDYITKPYQAEEVVARVSTHLAFDAMKKKIEAQNVKLAEEVIARKKMTHALSKAKHDAEAANIAKSEFLASMSHELRTPLNHIIGFSEILVDKHFGKLNNTQEEYLNDILNSGRHLLSLINDILHISRVETGKMELDLSEFDPQFLLLDCTNIIKEKADKQDITVESMLDDLPETIRADERKLKQVLYNLLANAVKFSPQGGKIELRAQRLRNSGENSDPEIIRISVSDNGIGVLAGDLERIFGAFERSKQTVKRNYNGTGLGLYLSRQIIELHGGRIWAESDGIDRGSMFIFELPLADH